MKKLRRKARRSKNEPSPRYLERIAAGWSPGPGKVAELVILHDDGCAHWRGRPCNCDPDIRPVLPLAGRPGAVQ